MHRWFFFALVGELLVHVRGVAKPIEHRVHVRGRHPRQHQYALPQTPAPPASSDAASLDVMDMFRDTIEGPMPAEWKMVEPGRPDSHVANVASYQYMAPQFVDLNGDGHLDMVVPNHCSRCRFLDIQDAVKMWSSDNGTSVDQALVAASGNDAASFVKTFCSTVWGWDLGLAQPAEEPGPDGAVAVMSYEPVRAREGHVRITDDMWRPMRKAFSAPGGVIGEGKDIADVEGRLWMADTHGFAVLDLDGDGRQDVMMTIGADRGIGKSASDRNALLWGDGNATHWRLTGGRDEAQVAGVDSFMGRSRGVTFFDADNDGVLDMYIANVAREDDLIIPSTMLVSNGRNRRWKPARGSGGHGALAQYTVKAVLADMDADGHMNELVMALSECPAGRTLQPHNNNEPHLDPTADQAVLQDPDEFCQERGQGSLLVLKLDGTGGATDFMYQFPLIKNFKLALVSGDIDNDGVADLVVLQQRQVMAFLARNVQRGQLLFEAKPIVVARLGADTVPVDIALADFDLDGDLDMFVVGEQPGTSHVFTNVGEENGYFVRDLDMFGVAPHPHATGNKPVAMGATVADMNNDGYPDVFVAYNRASGLMLKNNAKELYDHAYIDPPRRISISLLGNVANTQGIGASVVMYTTPLPNNITRQLRQVSVAQRSVGHDDGRVTFTLGRESKMEKLVITWPSGFVQTVRPRRLGRAHEGSIVDPMLVEEAAVLGFAGRMRECMRGAGGGVVESTAIRLALARHPGVTDPPEFTRMRRLIMSTRSGTAKFPGMYLLRSTERVELLSPDDVVDTVDGTRLLGGVPHTPPGVSDVGEVECSNGMTARSHLKAMGQNMFRALPVHQLVVNKPGAPHLPPYSAQVNRFSRDDLPDPCSADAPTTMFYQFLDTTTCSLTPVFHYSAQQCCADLQRTPGEA